MYAANEIRLGPHARLCGDSLVGTYKHQGHIVVCTKGRDIRV